MVFEQLKGITKRKQTPRGEKKTTSKTIGGLCSFVLCFFFFLGHDDDDDDVGLRKKQGMGQPSESSNIPLVPSNHLVVVV